MSIFHSQILFMPSDVIMLMPCQILIMSRSGVLSIRTRLSGQQKVKERERAKEMQALIEGTLDDYDKKNKKRTKGVEKKLRGMDFVGEGADVIIEGKERHQKKKETPWERDLRQGQYGKALDSVLERKLESVIVSERIILECHQEFRLLYRWLQASI